jgi:hypothetical protein
MLPRGHLQSSTPHLTPGCLVSKPGHSNRRRRISCRVSFLAGLRSGQAPGIRTGAARCRDEECTATERPRVECSRLSPREARAHSRRVRPLDFFLESEKPTPRSTSSVSICVIVFPARPRPRSSRERIRLASRRGHSASSVTRGLSAIACRASHVRVLSSMASSVSTRSSSRKRRCNRIAACIPTRTNVTKSIRSDGMNAATYAWYAFARSASVRLLQR